MTSRFPPPRLSFPPTDWRVVKAAAQKEGLERTQALEALLSQYLPILRQYLVLKFRESVPNAEDLLQDFVVEKLLSQGVLQQASRARGKFRSLLVSALTNFVISEFRRARAIKRAPDQAALPLEAVSGLDLAAMAAQASRQLDLAFAKRVFAEAQQRMHDECATSGRPELWAVFYGRVMAPLLEDLEPTPVAQLMRQLNFKSSTQLSNALVTAKRMFARNFRHVVIEYVLDEDRVDEEVQELKQILAEG